MVDKELIHAYFLVAMPLELNIFKLTFTVCSRFSFTPTDKVWSNKALRRTGWGVPTAICTKKIIYCRAFKGKQAKVTVLQSTKYFPDILEKVNVITRFTK